MNGLFIALHYFIVNKIIYLFLNLILIWEPRSDAR